MPEATTHEIGRHAFELWQQAGCPEGKDKDLARQAEQELRGRRPASDERIPRNTDVT
jgi:hypothetical protein